MSEERRVVTTLFCDIVAFTALSERADPEDVDRLLAEYFARVTLAIEAHGGTVEKFIGDAVVAAFGVPAVHEDDPERAVRAGLHLVEDLEGLTRPGGAPLEVRVGVNTGEVLVRLGVDPASGRGFLTGDAVNIAARLQGVAPPMGVAVGEATYAATQRVFRYDACHPVALKGKSEPVRAWIAVEPLARTGSDLRSFTASFFGREEELAQLTSMLERAVSEREVQTGLVVGEPGIGKSRLLAEFARRLDDGHETVTWRQGRCLPFGSGITFWALSEIVRDSAGILETDGVARAEACLETVLTEGDQRHRLRARLRPLLGLASDEASREENFAAWREFLEGLAAAAPTVVVIEDVHWADEGMLTFLDFLAESAAQAPLLIVATGRQEVLGLAGAGATFVSAAERVPLGALSADETAQLVVARLGAKALSVKLQGTLLERSSGNPLFAEELVCLLQDRDLLVTRGGQMMLKEGAELPTPDSIGSLIAARLDVLTPRSKALLADAAVVGRTFWAGAVAAVRDEEPTDVYQGLMELVAKELVRPERSSTMEGETEFVFVHALVRDVAYGQLTRVDRAAKHAALAQWLELRTAGRTEDVAEILAYHYGIALEMADACGLFDQVDALVDPTARYLEMAGGRAAPLDAAAAAAHFARAEKVADEAARPKRRFFLSRRARRSLRRRAPLLVAAIAVIVVAVVAAFAVYEFRPAGAAELKYTPSQIATKYGNAVVDITGKVRKVVDGQVTLGRVHQVGVVVSKDGLIFTSGSGLARWPVMVQPLSVTVGVYDSGGQYRKVRGELLTYDGTGSVAILRVDPAKAKLTYVPPGDSDSVKVGEQVVVGSRFGGGLSGDPTTVGRTVSGQDTLSGRGFGVLVMETKSQPKGPTGGGVVDLTGHAVGIMTNMYDSDHDDAGDVAGPNVAMGTDWYRQVVDNAQHIVATDPAKVTLGIDRDAPVTPGHAASLGLPVDSGVLVEDVVAGSPAAKAGLRGGTRVVTYSGAPVAKFDGWDQTAVLGGDIIVGVDDLTVRTEDDMQRFLEGAEPGRAVTVHIVRDGTATDLRLTPDARWPQFWIW
jgi:class 3 adenylate cyclase/S1-C subfamily serine protease